VTVRLEIAANTTSGAPYASVQLPRGALYRNCPPPEQPLPAEGERQQLIEDESVPLACGCIGTDCIALFELRPIIDHFVDLHLFILNAPYVHDDTQNYFRINVGFLPTEPRNGWETLGDDWEYERASVIDELAAARKESWRIIPRLLDITVFPRRPEVEKPPRPLPGDDPLPPDPRTRTGGTAAGSVCVFEVTFTPVHDAQYFVLDTLLPDEGVDFTAASCIQGCEAVLPAAGSGNRTDVNSSFSTFIEMFEAVPVEILLSNVVLGPNGGPGRFLLKTFSYQEDSRTWFEEDESTEDVGYYPGNLGAIEMVGFYRDTLRDETLSETDFAIPGPVLWRIRNKFWGSEGETPVKGLLPPRRGETFFLEAVVMPTQPANHLEITCVDTWTNRAAKETLMHPVGSDGPVSIDRQSWGLPGAMGHMGAVAWKGKFGEEYYLRVPLKRDVDCVLYVETYTYDDALYGPGGRALTGTNDGYPVIRLSDPIEAYIEADRAPPLSKIRTYVSWKAIEGENVTLVAPPGFSFPDDACVEIEDQVCERVPAPVEEPVNSSALFFLTPGVLSRAVVRVVGPPAPAPDTYKITPSTVPRPPRVRPPWYVVTDRAERWQEMRGLRIPALAALLTVPAIPGLREARCSVEFTLEGFLADPFLTTGDSNPEELRGALLRLTMPEGYEPICDLELDFVGQDCEVYDREAVVTLQRRLRRGDYTHDLATTHHSFLGSVSAVSK
jgi:hypothetical protein